MGVKNDSRNHIRTDITGSPNKGFFTNRQLSKRLITEEYSGLESEKTITNFVPKVTIVNNNSKLVSSVVSLENR